MSIETKPDLHGIEKQPFPSFDETCSYLEGVTITSQPLAEEKFCEAWGVEPDEIDVQPIHMRYVTEDPDPIAVPDLPCWLECDGDHPDAVPFWKVEP